VHPGAASGLPDVHQVIPIRTEIIRHCQGAGLDYMGAIIWQKLTTTHTTGGASVMGSYPYPRNPILSIDYEFILVFKQLGKAPRVSKEAKEASRMTHHGGALELPRGARRGASGGVS